MKNSDCFQILFDATRSLELVKTQDEFSRLCGRDLSIGVLITLVTTLERLCEDRIPRSKRSHSQEFIKSLWLMVESKAMERIG